MLASKKDTIKSLLESWNGFHLSIYLNHTGDIDALKEELQHLIDVAEEYLAPAMKEGAVKKFLLPLQLLLADDKRLKRFSGSLGVFRTTTTLRVLNLPFSVENTCIVADSFHVKPLLKWLQLDREFFLLGFDSAVATLYQGSLQSFRQVDSVLIPEVLRSERGIESNPDWGGEAARQRALYETIEWLESFIMKQTSGVKPKLFIAGELAGGRKTTRFVLNVLQYENSARKPYRAAFSEKTVSENCSEIRSLLKADIQESFEKSLVEFQDAVEGGFAKGNAYTIAKAAAQGRVKKLLISDGIKIFGKFDRKTGSLVIHQKDLNAEDDDILDDLAQTVLETGGEVVIASMGEIPQGRPLLAILDEPRPSLVAQTFLTERGVL